MIKPLSPIIRSRSRASCSMWRCNQNRRVRAFCKSRSQPTFIARVLQKSAHEICHSRNHFADGQVFTKSQTTGNRCRLHCIAHAMKHLQFDGVHRKSSLLDHRKSCTDRSCVVRSKCEFHTTHARALRSGSNESTCHPFEARVRISLHSPNG